MIDGFLVAVGVGFAGAMVAGPSLAYGVRALPLRWRRTTEWLLIAAAAIAALLADLLLAGPAGGVFVYVLAALPGVVAFLGFRTLLATALVSLAPLYFVIGHLTRDWPTFVPDVALDRATPLWPEWMLVYGSLYVFAFLMPILIVRQPELFGRALKAYLTVMLASYLGFLLFPTAAPRPAQVPGDSFDAWALRLAYEIDPPHGCLPSLHVAYSFVSALACWRVHRGVGAGALLWAALIGLSALFTKQHYILDVFAGALLAYAAYLLFLRSYPRDLVPAIDRHKAPARAMIVAGMMALTVVGFWAAYRLR